MKKSGTFLFVSHFPPSDNIQYQWLFDSDYTFTWVNSDQAALDFFAQQKTSLDLVITEFNGPDINGMLLLSHLRQHKQLCHTPVICILDEKQHRNIISAYDSGATHCVYHDLDINVLMSIIENCILVGKTRQHAQKQRDNLLSSFEACQIIAAFFIESLQCVDHNALADLLLDTVKSFYFETSAQNDEHYLRCTIRMQGEDEVIHVSDRGMISKVDCSILRQAAEHGNIIKKFPYTALPSASGNTSILIRNTPEDPRQEKRAMSIIQSLIDRFDDRLSHFQQEQKVRRQKENLETKEKQINDIVMSCAKELDQVNSTYQEMKEKHMDLLEGLAAASIVGVEDLSGEQISQLQQNISAMKMKAMDLFCMDQITDQKFLLTIQELHRILGNEDNVADNLTPGQMAEQNDQGNVDDLLASLGL